MSFLRGEPGQFILKKEKGNTGGVDAADFGTNHNHESVLLGRNGRNAHCPGRLRKMVRPGAGCRTGFYVPKPAHEPLLQPVDQVDPDQQKTKR